MKNDDRKPHITDLTHQVLVHIFKNLTFQERNIASETCRFWYLTANDHSFNKRKVICCNNFRLSYRNNIGNPIQTYLNSPVTFYNYIFYISRLSSVVNDFWVELGGKLRSLKISNCTLFYMDVVHILKSCKELRVLSLQSCYFYRPKDPSTITNNKCNYELLNLKSLDLSESIVFDEIFKILVKHSPAIEELNLSECYLLNGSQSDYKDGLNEYNGALEPGIDYFKTNYVLEFIKSRSKNIKHLTLPEINDTYIILLSKLKDLFLESLGFSLSSNTITVELISEFIMGQKFLKKLVLKSPISNKLILDICTYFTDLEYLDISYCPYLTDYGISQLHTLNKLRTLRLPLSRSITNEGIKRSLNQQLNCFLQELAMPFLKISESTLIGFLEIFPNLKDLDVSYQEAVTDKSLQVICKYQTQLKVLSLRGCKKVLYLGIYDGDDEESNISNDKTKPGLYSLKRLRILNLEGCCNIKSKCIKRSFHLPNLVKLNLSRCSNITDESMEYIVQNCPNIENLNVRDCSYLTNKSMEIIGTSLKYLKFLDINVGHS